MRQIVPFVCILLLTCSTPSKTCEQFPVPQPTPQIPNSCAHDDKTFRCVVYLRNYDADTITVNIPGVHALVGQEIGVRVRGLDTPEIRTKDACEKRAGQKAQKLVEQWLKSAKRIDLKDVGRDKYFRILATVEVDGQDLTKKLLEAKLAYVYQGGTKAKINWCTL